MGRFEESRVLSRATLLAPPGMQNGVDRRVHVNLVETGNGRYRWFRDDGTPTVVDGSSIERAHVAAKFAWRAWDLQIEPLSAPTN
jgi:hypothetical protein